MFICQIQDPLADGATPRQAMAESWQVVCQRKVLLGHMEALRGFQLNGPSLGEFHLVGGDWNMTFIFPCTGNDHPI